MGDARAVILTISTSKARGEGEDESGPKLLAWARAIGAQIAATEVLPDDRHLIEQRLRHWADSEGCELILTTGRHGFAPGDVTPEASRAVIEGPPGNLRGDAGRLAGAQSPLDALQGRRGNTRQHPRDQLPREPGEHRAGGGGDRRIGATCDRVAPRARGLTRLSRCSPGILRLGAWVRDHSEAEVAGRAVPLAELRASTR